MTWYNYLLNVITYQINCHADVRVSIPAAVSKKHMRIFFLIFHLQYNDIKFRLRLFVSSERNWPTLWPHRAQGGVNDNIINMLLYQLWTSVTSGNFTRFINRKNSSSKQTSQAPDQENDLSSGPKMHYWVKRIDEKKDPIVSSYQQERSARRPIWRPISGKEKWKARGKMQRRPLRCLRQKTNKKDPILIFICADIGSLLYLCSHRLFQRTLTFPQQN